MGNYNNKNKQQRDHNQRPIEQRSDKICFMLVRELFSKEVDLLRNIISMDSKVDVSLNKGLHLVFKDGIDKVIKTEIRKVLKESNIRYDFSDSKELVIYK